MIRAHWVVRWAVGAPLAAVAATLFFASCWEVAWHGRSVAALAGAAWLLGMRAYWARPRGAAYAATQEGEGERRRAVTAMVAMSALLLFWAGWRLPSGLVTAAIPIAALAAIDGALGPGGSTGLREVRLWLRAVAFTGAVWLPLVWWDGAGLIREFLRLENASFVMLVYLVGRVRASERAGRGRAVAAPVLLSALFVGGLAAAGFVVAWMNGLAATRTVYGGVVAGSVGLAGWLLLDGRWPRWLGFAGWLPEMIYVVMALMAG